MHLELCTVAGLPDKIRLSSTMLISNEPAWQWGLQTCVLQAVWLSMASLSHKKGWCCLILFGQCACWLVGCKGKCMDDSLTAKPAVWQLHISRLAARRPAALFILTACLVQQKAELQAAAEAAQHRLEAAAEAAAGEREAACSSLLAELHVRLRGQQSLACPASCTAACHTHLGRRPYLWSVMAALICMTACPAVMQIPSSAACPAGCLPPAGGSAGLCCSPCHTPPDSC